MEPFFTNYSYGRGLRHVFRGFSPVYWIEVDKRRHRGRWRPGTLVLRIEANTPEYHKVLAYAKAVLQTLDHLYPAGSRKRFSDRGL